MSIQGTAAFLLLDAWPVHDDMTMTLYALGGGLTIVKCDERPDNFFEFWETKAFTRREDRQSIIAQFEWPWNTLVERTFH
jgi:hypothetical protein